MFNVRFNDLWNAQTLSAELRGRVERALGGAGFTLAFEPSNADAFLTAPGAFTDLVANSIQDVMGIRPAFKTNGGTSDARFIKNHCPVIEFGPVGKTMHAIDERVPVAELETLERIYRRVLERYFA